MTVLHVTTVPQSLKFLNGQVGYMKDHGFSIHAASSPGPLLDAFGAKHGVQTHAVPMTRRITPLKDLAALFRLMRVIRRIRPAIVHSHTPKGGLLGMLAAFLCGVPVRIYHQRGLPFETATGFRRHLLRLTETVTCGLAHQVICVSDSLKQVSVTNGMCPPGKIRVLVKGSGNGVDAVGRFNPEKVGLHSRQEIRKQWGIPDSAQVVGFVGRIVCDKGIVELAEAWADIREEFAEAHLMIVGPVEPYGPVPPAVLEQLQNDDRVHLVGEVRHTELYYAAMDVLVLPTYREGFPNVLLEAAAMGLPVVSTKVTGPVDAVVDGVTGTLVPPRDARALVRAIRRYLLDPDLARWHGQAGRERVLTDFRPEMIWAALRAEYERLLVRARHRPRPAL